MGEGLEKSGLHGRFAAGGGVVLSFDFGRWRFAFSFSVHSVAQVEDPDAEPDEDDDDEDYDQNEVLGVLCVLRNARFKMEESDAKGTYPCPLFRPRHGPFQNPLLLPFDVVVPKARALLVTRDRAVYLAGVA